MGIFKLFSRTDKYCSSDKKIIKEFNCTRPSKKRKYLCYAPFQSLTFFLGGDILACWHNKQFILGHYPGSSISEVWFGENLKKLRNYISHNDLSCGCAECNRQLSLKNYNSVGAKGYDFLPAQKSNYPIALDFQTSNTCNLECIMCNGEYSSSIRENREKEPPYSNPYDSNFIEQLIPFIPHLQVASFSGGEVFMTQLYFDIWENFYKINPDIIVSVTTNGSFLNNKVIDVLEKLRFNINLSIDSITEENYEAIRKNASYETTFKNLDYYINYVERKKTHLSVRICPLIQNWQELPQLCQFLNDRNIDFYFNTVIFPPSSSLLNLPSQKLQEVINYLTGFIFVSDSTIQKNNSQNYLNLLHQLDLWFKNIMKNKEKHPLLHEYTIEKLIEILISQVRDYYLSYNTLPSDDKNKNIAQFENSLHLCCEKIKDNEILKNALKYYLMFPVNRLIDEFNLRTIDKIVSLTKQAGR